MMNTKYQTIIVDRQEHVQVIRLNRPERMNAVIKPLYDDMLAALDQAEKDDDIFAVVITGNGRAFCAGADLKAHKEGRTQADKEAYLAAEQLVCAKIYHHSKPVIALVNGYAIGAGFELALNCDFLLMAESAQLSLPEVDLGTFVGGGVSWLLPRMIGLAPARKLLYGECHNEDDRPANRISSQLATDLGLATSVYKDENFFEQAMVFVQKIANKPTRSVQKMKRAIRQGLEGSFDDALRHELNEMIDCSGSADWQNNISKVQ